MVVEVTDLDFSKVVLESNIPVVVDFWAPWCGPCKALSPVLDEISKETDEYLIVKCNVEDCDDTVSKYGIRNVPTLLFIVNGEVVDRATGNLGKGIILEKLSILK